MLNFLGKVDAHILSVCFELLGESSFICIRISKVLNIYMKVDFLRLDLLDCSAPPSLLDYNKLNNTYRFITSSIEE